MTEERCAAREMSDRGRHTIAAERRIRARIVIGTSKGDERRGTVKGGQDGHGGTIRD
jgi:hypothetical protein